MQIASKTDIGKLRESNQDFVKTHIFDDGAAFLVVCDGMGGAAAGNVASEVAANAIFDYILKKYATNLNSHELKTIMTSAINRANLDVFDLAQSNEQYYGMGTTVVATIIKDGYAYTVHAGDSRAYIAYPDKIEQVTLDHSIVQQLLASGLITQEESKTHPKRNVITRALGIQECLELDYNTTKLNKDFSFLLCTDGLTNMVDDKIICQILANNDSSDACDSLIEHANANGGSDNITVALAKENKEREE